MKRATQAELEEKNYIEISIHALVKRATEVADYMGFDSNISIHALVKRAT